jgi:hypothetical protein
LDAAWLAAGTALAVAVAGFTAWAARYLWKILRRVVHFLDDYSGQPARDGMPGTPGFMARLGSVEGLAARIAAEMHPNGGLSLRDVVDRTSSDVVQLRTQVESIQRKGGGR